MAKAEAPTKALFAFCRLLTSLASDMQETKIQLDIIAIQNRHEREKFKNGQKEGVTVIRIEDRARSS